MKRYYLYERRNIIIAEHVEKEECYYREHDLVYNIEEKVFQLNYYGDYGQKERYSTEVLDCSTMQEEELFQYSLVFHFEHLNLEEIAALQKEMKGFEDRYNVYMQYNNGVLDVSYAYE